MSSFEGVGLHEDGFFVSFPAVSMHGLWRERERDDVNSVGGCTCSCPLAFRLAGDEWKD